MKNNGHRPSNTGTHWYMQICTATYQNRRIIDFRSVKRRKLYKRHPDEEMNPNLCFFSYQQGIILHLYNTRMLIGSSREVVFLGSPWRQPVLSHPMAHWMVHRSWLEFLNSLPKNANSSDVEPISNCRMLSRKESSDWKILRVLVVSRLQIHVCQGIMHGNARKTLGCSVNNIYIYTVYTYIYI